jgi:hypothetical protein
MARAVSLQSIVDKARILADMKSSNFISNAEALALVNDCFCELYDELVGSYEDYYSATETLTLTTGTNEYDLPDDFYKMIGVDFQVNNDAYITLRPYQNAERNVTLTTNVTIPSGSLRLRYVPAPPIFTDLATEVDGVAGWDRLMTLSLAIDFLNAEESDTTALQAKYDRTLKRIRDMANPRDTGMAFRISDIYRPNIQMVYGALQYHMYGNSLVLISTEFLGADMFPPFV